MKLSIRATTLSSALTTLIMVLLLVPIHLARWHFAAAMRAHAAGGSELPIHPMPHAMMMRPDLGWPFIAWILLFIAVLVVYAGVGGFIFSAIYNAFAPKQ